MTNLQQLDRTIFAWINVGWSNSVFDIFMPWISHTADPTTVWLWILVLGLLIGRQLAQGIKVCKRSGQRHVLMKAIGSFCLYTALIYGVNAAVYGGLKHLVHRPRPFAQQMVVLRVSSTTASGLPKDSSFPSGHACNAFMVAALFAQRLRRKRCVLYGMAGLVALSRIYLGVHYPSDVIAGACLSLAITWLMLSLRPQRDRATHEDHCRFQD